MFTLVTMAAWKMVMLYVLVFGAGWVIGKLDNFYDFNKEDDEIEES